MSPATEQALAALRASGLHVTAQTIEDEILRLEHIIELQGRVIQVPGPPRTCALCLSPITAGYCRCL